MIRHWQHTSFCMGQCVSSCGSKRTLDSVPTTPDTENYPGLIPATRSVNFSSTYSSGEQALDLSNKSPSRGNPALKFVTAFSQKKIAGRRINPESGSPLLVSKNSPPSTLPLKITTLLTPAPANQHGDMKGSPAKSYFRETVSSAKKSSKTVTFLEGTPPGTSNISRTRKKPFFLFGRSTSKAEAGGESTDSQLSSFSKGFLRRKPKNPSPAPEPLSKQIKEKQICRVTLSPKQGNSKLVPGKVLATSTPENQTFPSCKLPRKTNGDISGDKVSEKECLSTRTNQTMGNVTSNRQTLLNEASKKSLHVVKSSSENLIKDFKKGDINENTTPFTLITSKSVESAVFSPKNDNEFSKISDPEVFRNINARKEENRQLRLKFFLEDSSNSNITGTSEQSSQGGSLDTTTGKTKMSRQTSIISRSAIPLPKSTVVKSVNNVNSGLPKLYSVPLEHDQTTQKGTISRIKPATSLHQQPTNLDSGKWVPAANFFDESTGTESLRPQSSPVPTRSNRRSSEPLRFSAVPITAKLTGKPEVGVNLERRETFGFQPRKFPSSQPPGIPRVVKPVLTASTKSVSSFKSSLTKIAVKKPEETKPFYTIGLYQNRPKPPETAKSFGVLQSGFQGVSTGMVKQRTEQYQSKVGDASVGVTKPSSVCGGGVDKGEQKNRSIAPSSRRPGVMRSATYTIRKHPSVEPVCKTHQGEEKVNKPGLQPGSDVDQRYLTWTVRNKGSKHQLDTKSSFAEAYAINDSILQREGSISPESSNISSMTHDQVGYPLQHDPSGTSTSSMGTNEDGAGDHVVISDSEYLIDDEISDQPDLTLTFKDSSLMLSPSSSGESLLSLSCDIMLDHAGHHSHDQNRILGELTSDSAISDISSHKPTSQSSNDQISKFSDIKRTVLDETAKMLDVRSSPSDTTASPSSVRTVRHPKSPRRNSNSKPVVSAHSKTPVRYPSGDTSIPRLTTSSFKSPISSTTVTAKCRITTAEKKLPLAKPHVRSVLTNSTSLSPNQNTTNKDHVVGLTIENVTRLHKQFELENCEFRTLDNGGSSLPVPLIEELMSEFHGLKSKLEHLQIQLETQEKREREKDELIMRLTKEVERLNSGTNGEKLHITRRQSSDLIAIKPGDPVDLEHKERYLNSLNYENAAVQTENNNIFNRSVTYPEEEDKYGELVRIGRSSSVKKKL